MKIRILSAVTAGLLMATAASAQYYVLGEQARGKNVVYNVLPAGSTYYLIDNAENKLTGMEPTKLFELKNEFNYVEIFFPVKYTVDPVVEAVKKVLTPEEIADFMKTNEKMNIFDKLSRTGEVLELSFTFRRDSKLLSISPDRLYRIEQLLKKSLAREIKTEEYNNQDFYRSATGIIFNKEYFPDEK